MNASHPDSVSNLLGGRRDDAGWVTLVNTLLRGRRIGAACALILFAAVVIPPLTRSRAFTSTASVQPQTRRGSSSSLPGLAAQLGLTLQGGEGTQTLAFYSDLLKSRAVLEAAVQTEYDIVSNVSSSKKTLLEFWRIKAPSEALRLEAGVRRLSLAVDAAPVARTGVVHVGVTTEDATLSRRVAERLISLLNDFNLQTRRSQASMERQFTQQRAAEVKAELRSAEDRHQEFLQRNRAFAGSAELRFEEDRLTREVAMLQQLYTSVAQAYEQARIEEVRDTPVITVVERPTEPASPDPRGLISKGLLALLVGASIGGMLSLVREQLSPIEETRDPFDEMTRLRRDALRDLRAPWRMLSSR